jgi:hypothetical protein
MTEEETERALSEQDDGQLRAFAAEEPMLRWFTYAHLPPRLQKVSRGFCSLAIDVFLNIERSAERTVALRKLLEGKDAAVRAALG